MKVPQGICAAGQGLVGVAYMLRHDLPELWALVQELMGLGTRTSCTSVELIIEQCAVLLAQQATVKSNSFNVKFTPTCLLPRTDASLRHLVVVHLEHLPTRTKTIKGKTA